MWQTEQLIVCFRGGWVGGWAGVKELVGLRRGGGSEVSDEHSTSLTVVLHDGKHQSQVIYSLPLAGTLPLFFLVMYVCKHQTKKTTTTGNWPDRCSHCKSIPVPAPPPLPFVCLHPFKSAMHAWLVPSINLSVPLYRFSFTLFFFFMHALFPPSPCLLALRPSGVKCFVIVKRQP